MVTTVRRTSALWGSSGVVSACARVIRDSSEQVGRDEETLGAPSGPSHGGLVLGPVVVVLWLVVWCSGRWSGAPAGGLVLWPVVCALAGGLVLWPVVWCSSRWSVLWPVVWSFG